jgi:uncharacterized repeat protein (TIGR01451 family)
VSRFVSVLLLLALAGVLSAAAPATERRSVVATVTGVVAADTLDVRLASGGTSRVRVAGVRAPTAGACYADEASAEARRLALGKRVALVRDGAGAYVRLPGGADLGLALVLRGFAQIDAWGPSFARFPAYVPAQQRAERANGGIWGACAADVAVALDAAPRPAAVGGRLTYTVTVSNGGPLAAPNVGLELRPPVGVELVSAESPDGVCAAREWVGTCTFASLAAAGTAKAIFVAEIRRAGTISTRAVVRLAGCVRAACGMAPLHDSNLSNDETAALSTATDGSLPPSPPSPPPSPGPASPPPPPSAGGCHPSYPSVCIPPPPPDLDCADIPYRDFAAPLNAPDPDPHDLDGDEDGVGCQFNDY